MNSISGFKFPDQLNKSSSIQQNEKNQPSFKETLKKAFLEVNDLQKDAKQSVEQFLNGEISDVHDVMIAAEKASIGLQLTLAIRNKLLDSFREIMRIHG